MSKLLKKISRLSFVFIPAIVLGYSSFSYSATIPELYKFLPEDTVISLNIKTSPADWPVLSMNKSLQKIDFFKELRTDKDDNPMNILLDPQVTGNLGNNVLVSVSAIDSAKDPQIMLVAEMKNSGKNDYIKSLFNKMYLSKKDGKLVEGKYKDTTIFSYVAKDPKNTKYDPSYLAFSDNYVLMTNNFNAIQSGMKNYYQDAKGLSYSSDFVKSYDKLGSGHQLQLYLNTKKLFNFIQGMDKKTNITKDMDMAMFKDVLSMNTLMANFQANPENITLKTYITVDKATDYYKTLQLSKPSDFKKYTNYIPKNALLFMGVSDLKEAGKNFKEKLSFYKDIDFEGLIQEATGIDIISFADNLKNDMAIAAFNTESNPLIPGFALFMTPTDKDKMEIMFRGLKVDLSGFDKKTGKGNRKQNEGAKAAKKSSEVLQFTDKTTYKDITIYQTNELADMAELNARPAYAFLGEDVILASNEEAIKTIIDRSTVTATDFTLNGNSSFIKLKDAFGNDNNGIFFLNLSTIINMASSFLAGEKDAKEMITNLKKIEALGMNSLNDEDGSLGNFIILADLKSIDFNKLIPEDKKPKIKATIKKEPAKKETKKDVTKKKK
jgi:hypothetical protein